MKLRILSMLSYTVIIICFYTQFLLNFNDDTPALNVVLKIHNLFDLLLFKILNDFKSKLISKFQINFGFELF